MSSETQKGRRVKGKSVRKTASNNKNNNTEGKPRKASEKTKGKALTLKELDDLVKKLDEKRSMCWNFVSEELKNQYVVQHYKTHRELINEILDDKYTMNSVRDLVLHMYSLYTKLVLEIYKDVKKDRKAYLSCKMERRVTVSKIN